ncbi:MAG: hypothetical protein HFH09_02275 [Bacilli bacterium]|jgi:hypothetical protein|nr:hypothetical protein [Bacilli bacterium]
MIKKIDIGIFRSSILSNELQDISNELKKFDVQNCTFYYDESNNHRKLWLNNNNFNVPIDKDFILGGVMFFQDQPLADINALKNKLQLQKSIKEIKFKHISKAKSFLDCLKEDNISIFLKWLYNSDLYIHYSNINNLYFAIVDIIDSIIEPTYIPFSHQMKNELYKLVHSHYKDFYQLLIQYSYPNISPNNIAFFYQQILDFIDDHYSEYSFNLEILRQGLKSAKKQSQLAFLEDNLDKTIIDNYSTFYMRPIALFPFSKHIFDNEYKIEEVFKGYEFYNGENKLENYHFMNSQSNIYIQISDCIVGLLGKFYTYINDLDKIKVQSLFKTISAKQLNTLKLFAKIIIKSENLSKLLLHSVESINERETAEYILWMALSE